jgi:hypothetical protein
MPPTRQICLQASSFSEPAWRQPYLHQLSFRPAKDATNRMRRNPERLGYFASRMGSLTAKPEVQPDGLFLQWAEDPEEPCYAIEIHGHLTGRISDL